MSPILLLVFVAGLLTFALTRGYVGVHGAAVHRAENAPLYWGQVAILTVGAIVIGVAIARGDL